jgi:predicted glycosyltransferase
MLRVALYSHDTYGLGHLRRCLKVAGALATHLDSVRGLILTGSPWAERFAPPRGFRFAKLLPVVKSGPEDYRPRDSSLSLDEVLRERRRVLSTELSLFGPDLLIVDNVPCGLHGEILQLLRTLKEGRKTRLVLALRDVIDEEGVVRREWKKSGAYEALEELYDEVWIFGPADAPIARSLPPMCLRKAVICGCLGANGHSRQTATPSGLESRSTEPRILVTGGGGGDARSLIATYVDALETIRPNAAHRLVLGPDYPDPAELGSRDLTGLGVQVVSFDSNVPKAMREADVVVSMAGYNTVCEALALGLPLVLVPRTWPRQEQLLRARALAVKGRAEVVLPHELTPARLWRAVESALSCPAPSPAMPTGGLRAAERVAHLLGDKIMVG